jgi:hypothetical protein
MTGRVTALRSRDDLELGLWALSVGGYSVYPIFRADTGQLAKWVWVLPTVKGEYASPWYVDPDGSDTPPLTDELRERIRAERDQPMVLAAERARQRERALGIAEPFHPSL